MFGAIAKIFKRKPDPAPVSNRSTKPAAQPAVSQPSTPASRNETRPAPPVKGSPRAVAGTFGNATAPAPATGPVPGGGNAIAIPYASIIRCVPQDLWGKLAPAGAGAAEFTIARDQVLEQLPQGAVKISFAELRRHGPAGLFANNASQENRLIDLPLSDILGQLHPNSFARRADQAKIEVSEEVPDLFGVRGERIAPVRVMDKQEAAASTAATRQNIPPQRNVVPVEAKSFQTPPASSRPSGSAAPGIAPLPSSPRGGPSTTSGKPTSFQSAPPTPKPAPAPPVTPLSKPAAKPAAPAARALPKAAPAKPGAAPSNPPAPASDAFLVPIDAVATDWPEEIRQELARMKTPGARLAIPSADICEGLKRGIVQFSWRSLRLWIQPQPLAAGASPFDDVVVELPLDTITPLFLDHIRSSPAQRQVADYETITEFFRRKEVVATPATTPLGSAPTASTAASPTAPPAAGGTLDLPLSQLSAG
ncbi:MAG: hypothetical protein QOF48_3130, partial [Verrucomicrobiota bacterium]